MPTPNPSSELDLCYLPARDQLDLFKAGKLSPVDVCKAQIARAEEVEPAVNAFLDFFPEEALAAARKAEAVYAKNPDDARPLEGITVAVKDDTPVKGQRCTVGSLIYKDYYPDFDHPVAARMRAAGAIFHARSAVPEFCSAWVTDTRINGITRNPWGLDYTPSGSSGGAGASLAAGTTTLANGSDIGGSIRGPAGMCGVVGFKPPYGRVPDLPPYNLDNYCHIGAMSRTVADNAILQNVISGHYAQDIVSVREQMTLPLDYSGIKGKRIAYTMDVGNRVVNEDVYRQTMKAVQILSDAGAIMEEVDLGWGIEVAEGCKSYLDHLMGQGLRREVVKHPDLVCDYTVFLAERSAQTTAEDFLAAYDVAGKIYTQLGPMLENDYYAMICPTFASYEMSATQRPWDRMIVGGQDVDSDYDTNTQAPFNMLSRLPVLAVPTGISENGRPASVQIVTRTYDDPRCFAVAQVLEDAVGMYCDAARRPSGADKDSSFPLF